MKVPAKEFKFIFLLAGLLDNTSCIIIENIYLFLFIPLTIAFPELRKIFAKHFCNDFHAFKYFAAFRDKSKCGEKVRITSLTHYVLHRIGFKSEEKNAKILNK